MRTIGELLYSIGGGVKTLFYNNTIINTLVPLSGDKLNYIFDTLDINKFIVSFSSLDVENQNNILKRVSVEKLFVILSHMDIKQIDELSTAIFPIPHLSEIRSKLFEKLAEKAVFGNDD